MLAAAQAGAANLVYLDESGMSTLPNVQRAWSPRGQPHAADASVGKKRVNILGTLDSISNTLTHREFERSIRRADVVEWIDQLAARHDAEDKPTVVVLDNASIHRHIEADRMQAWWSQHRLALFYLPPYSPELNRIEILWKQAKYYWRKFESWTKQELTAKVKELLSGYGEKFEIHYA